MLYNRYYTSFQRFIQVFFNLFYSSEVRNLILLVVLYLLLSCTLTPRKKKVATIHKTHKFQFSMKIFSIIYKNVANNSDISLKFD